MNLCTLRRAIWMSAIGVVLSLCLLAIAWCLAPTALAQPTYTVVFADDGTEVDLDADFSGTSPLYSTTFDPNMQLSVLGIKDDQGNFYPCNVVCDKGTTWMRVGTYDLSLSATIDGATWLGWCTLIINPISLTASWSDLECQYGQTPNPTLRFWDGPNAVSWTTIQFLDSSASVHFEGPDGSDIDTYLSSENALLGTPGGTGKNQITAVFESTCYSLNQASSSAYFNLVPYQGSVEVTKTPDTISYRQEGYDLTDLYGVKIVDENLVHDTTVYSVTATVRNTNTNEEVESSTITNVGHYQISFHFEGKQDCFAFSATDTYDLEVGQGSTEMVSLADGSVTISYNPRRATYGNKSELDGSVYMAMGTYYTLREADSEVNISVSAATMSYAYSPSFAGAGAQIYEENWLPDLDYIGSLYVRITFAGNDRYMWSQCVLPLEIVPLDIADRVSFVPLPAAEGDPALSYLYNPDGVDNYVLPSVCVGSDAEDTAYQNYKTANPTKVSENLYYQRLVEDVWQDADPVLPGTYRAVLEVDSPLFVCKTTGSGFTIRKVMIGKTDITLSKTTFDYGDAKLFDITVDDSIVGTYGAITGRWTATYSQDGHASTAKNVGQYAMDLVLDDPLYVSDTIHYDQKEGITIAKRTVEVTLWDRTVAYGDTWYPNGLRYGAEGEGDIWWADGAVLQEDEQAFLQAITVWATCEGYDYPGKNSNFVAGEYGYPLHATANMDNYIVASSTDCGDLYITKRPLTVTITQAGSGGIYEKEFPVFNKNVSGTVYEDDAYLLGEKLQYAFYDTSGEEVASSAAFREGRYYVRVSIVEGEEEAFANYTVPQVNRVIDVLSRTLATGNGNVVVEGRYAQNSSITIAVSHSYNSALSKAADGYSVDTVYTILNPINPQSGRIDFTFACTAKGNVAVLYLEGSTWKKVSNFNYDKSAGVITFSQDSMSKEYAICVQKEINWLPIGIAAGAVVLAGIVVVIVIVLRKQKRTKELATQAAQSAVAPTMVNKASEEDELDDFIDNFDETTVERELTPAEKIALREREEKYAQYRARLQRLRGSDRTLSDTLANLGLDKNAADDEIIERMIAEDEERARQLQEELEREAEEKAKAEAAPTMVFVDHSDGVLEQQTYVPTQKDEEDLDDIDI